jgi:hypothetical protein
MNWVVPIVVLQVHLSSALLRVRLVSVLCYANLILNYSVSSFLFKASKVAFETEVTRSFVFRQAPT